MATEKQSVAPKRIIVSSVSVESLQQQGVAVEVIGPVDNSGDKLKPFRAYDPRTIMRERAVAMGGNAILNYNADPEGTAASGLVVTVENFDLIRTRTRVAGIPVTVVGVVLTVVGIYLIAQDIASSVMHFVLPVGIILVIRGLYQLFAGQSQ